MDLFCLADLLPCSSWDVGNKTICFPVNVDKYHFECSWQPISICTCIQCTYFIRETLIIEICNRWFLYVMLSLFFFFYSHSIFPDQYVGSKETLGKGEWSVRYEIGAVTITWWAGASLARLNLVDARRSHFGTTASLSTWFQSECWHFKVQFILHL